MNTKSAEGACMTVDELDDMLIRIGDDIAAKDPNWPGMGNFFRSCRDKERAAVAAQEVAP